MDDLDNLFDDDLDLDNDSSLDGSLDLDDTSDSFSDTLNNSNIGSDIGVSNPKRIGVIGGVVGLVIILVGLFISNIANSNKVDSDTYVNSNQQVTSNQQVNNNQQVTSNQQVNNNQQVTSNQQVNNNQQVTSNQQGKIDQPSISNGVIVGDSGTGGWVEFTGDKDIKFDGSAKSEFTVLDIKHLVKVEDGKGDGLVKSVVIGNISGLTGEYEVELPYESAAKLEVGKIIGIDYNYTYINDIKVVGKIVFNSIVG